MIISMTHLANHTLQSSNYVIDRHRLATQACVDARLTIPLFTGCCCWTRLADGPDRHATPRHKGLQDLPQRLHCAGFSEVLQGSVPVEVADLHRQARLPLQPHALRVASKLFQCQRHVSFGNLVQSRKN